MIEAGKKFLIINSLDNVETDAANDKNVLILNQQNNNTVKTHTLLITRNMFLVIKTLKEGV